MTPLLTKKFVSRQNHYRYLYSLTVHSHHIYSPIVCFFALIIFFMNSCRKDEAVREANASDVVNGSFFSFSTAAELKVLSLAATDELPTLEESERVFKKEITRQQWLADVYDKPAHLDRVGRVFGDIFGINKSPFILEDSRVLATNGFGAFESTDGSKSCSSGFENIVPWWSDTAVQMCPGMSCGPSAINCIPEDQMNSLRSSVRFEIEQRARFTYVQNLDWQNFWAGKWIYGDRYLAFAYAFESKLLEEGTKPKLTGAQQLEIVSFVKSFSLTEKKKSALPIFFPERAGVVTAPQYLKRFNNFRSRIRGLSQSMSCQDIGPSLNTSGISTFVNGDLSDFDKSHGAKGSCASCHYPMDNLGSSLLGWSDVGHREFWKQVSQKGHAFGAEIQGPYALMSTWVKQGPNFTECMAKQVWKSFSGGRDFGRLPDGRKSELIKASEQGFQNLVRKALALPELTKVDLP